MEFGPIQSIAARIQHITGRPAAAPAPPTDSPSFDPFGPVYQLALLQAGISPSTAARNEAVAYTTGSPTAVGPTNSIAKGFGEVEVPPELARFGNGRIPPDMLTPIGQGNHKLWGPAAVAWKDLIARAARAGIDLRITDSYRTYDQQVELAATKGLSSQGGWAATPGTSNHGWGMAVDADVTDPKVNDWLRANAGSAGWVLSTEREPWHYEYRPHDAG
ncbi:MAG: M15 family metallopeptidase [Ilumatobacteraceae bacterium]